MLRRQVSTTTFKNWQIEFDWERQTLLWLCCYVARSVLLGIENVMDKDKWPKEIIVGGGIS